MSSSRSISRSIGNIDVSSGDEVNNVSCNIAGA